MEQPRYRKIDMKTWPRREHFPYYRDFLKCGYSLTARVEVTEAVRFARETERRFFGCFLYAAARTVNGMEEMRMMVTPEGEPGIWEEVHPSFTVFHEDDHTFTDIWTEYQPDFNAFYDGYLRTVEQFGDVHGIKGRPGQPANFFCVSCVPWMDYTGYASYVSGMPSLFPIVTFGKYTEENGKYTLPVTLTISHAAADGYHASQFFRHLEENLREFQTR